MKSETHDFDPTAPTEVKVAEPPTVPTQVVTIDPTKRISNKKVDMLLLIDSLDPARKRLAEEVKADLMKQGAKYADGDDAFATMSASGENKGIDDARCVALLANKKIDLKALVKIGAISFDRKALAEVLTGAEIEGLLEPKPAKTPSLTVKAQPNNPPMPILKVMERLTGVAATDPTLFEPPAKEDKKVVGHGENLASQPKKANGKKK